LAHRDGAGLVDAAATAGRRVSTRRRFGPIRMARSCSTRPRQGCGRASTPEVHSDPASGCASPGVAIVDASITIRLERDADRHSFAWSRRCRATLPRSALAPKLEQLRKGAPRLPAGEPTMRSGLRRLGFCRSRCEDPGRYPITSAFISWLRASIGSVRASGMAVSKATTVAPANWIS